MSGTYSSSGSATSAASMPMDQVQPALNAVRAFDLGQIVVDGQGYTVYRYDRDGTKPPKSACEGTCAQLWKPVPAAATQLLEGIDKTKVGSLTRADGTDQATLSGWPLYRYAKDEMPGETAGQGVGGTWYPITPAGGKVLAKADPGQSDAFGL
ncbi:hypothetical protein FPZ12_034815 [Amycolatopsis acidicola]|uniref:Lipoprotein n=1 Tax=Amycolatopsis acidicola TaxID=2596893 RepID=A0A5N0UWE3_9PSEU|nr:hypothetical protein [Amycolatopsis acidicola]KAA9153342.1 hypothetical protein FPZ12_034815 [Amycolatopsis acidicola]